MDQFTSGPSSSQRPRIVVVGGGFAGIDLVKHLPQRGCRVLLIDRFNYHTFQPLLYQVATGGLNGGSIAYPLRRIFTRRSNVTIRHAEVQEIDFAQRSVATAAGTFEYDYLVLATGTESNFFGNRGAETYSLPLKSLPDALQMRHTVLANLEAALTARSPNERARLASIVIAGGGPTGVELAGAFAELRRLVLPRDYPELSEDEFRIVLVDGAERVLATMSAHASAAAERDLRELGVEVMLGSLVQDFDGHAVRLSSGEVIPTANLVWAAGVRGCVPHSLTQHAQVNRAGRVLVDPYNRVVGLERVFAIGDIALMPSGAYPHGHPMLAPVAKQQGRHLARNLVRLQRGEQLEPFSYRDKGALATVGRSRAVADFGRWSFDGFFAWVLWMAVHIVFLIGFRNRLFALFDWAWSFFTYERFVRLIIPPVEAVPTKRHRARSMIDLERETTEEPPQAWH